MNTEITIDELVLHGFPPGDRYAITEAVQAELARLFATENQPQAWTGRVDVPHLDAGTIETAPSASPDVVGTQVGAAIHQGVTR